ncbi:MAG: saccharopine dehydrogenase NADP-binding domain-containing protein [Actinomycetia bacterium]|nr:saccharopine dehydrogenase NADP-binding domain-containing protein [Actinomycetes bacterium]
MSDRDLDVVLLGATGFVGRLIAAHLVQTAPAQVRLGFAARNAAKLDALIAEIGPDAKRVELITIDTRDWADLQALVARTKVIATTVGPYIRDGMPLVRACAAAGTHYCDLTGETLFVKQSADECHEAAQESGARIVHACGFDSIPSDLGVLQTARRAQEAGAGTLEETVLRVRSLKGGLSGGTIDSGRQQAIQARADTGARTALADRYALSPDRANEPKGEEGLIDGRPPHTESGTRPNALGPIATVTPLGPAVEGVVRKGLKAVSVRQDEAGRWTAPFVMAEFNTRIVRRSNALLGWEYGRGFRYREVTDLGRGPQAPFVGAGMSAGLIAALAGLSFGPTRAILDRVLPKPGEGPSQESMAGGRFVMDIESRTSTGAVFSTRVAADKDPGYSGTAVMFGQAALALALDEDRLPDRAGVLTPATGIGEVLIERLIEHGFVFATEQVGAD